MENPKTMMHPSPPPAGLGIEEGPLRPTVLAERLDVLDGLRGIAAFAVVLYHYLARYGEAHWSENLYPHGDISKDYPFLLYFGDFGVLLFFTLSGFVIFMTLERSTGIVDFAVRRLARLWPCMLICATMSAIILNATGVAEYYTDYAFVRTTGLEYFSSIFFISPELVGNIIGINYEARWVEGVYWTLWAEVRFYGLIAMTYLIAGPSRFLLFWFLILLASAALETLRAFDPGAAFAYWKLFLALQPRYLGWFSLGIVGYLAFQNRLSPLAMVIAAVGLYSILVGEVIQFRGGVIGFKAARFATYCVVVALLVAVSLRSRILSPLRFKPIVGLGLISYPLYMFHEGPGMVSFMLAAEAGLDPWLAVFGAIVLVIVIATLVHRYVELPGKQLIMSVLRTRANSAQARFAILRYRN